MNALLEKKRTVKMCHLKLPLVSALTDDFQASEAEILNKLRKVETNKSSTLGETSPVAFKESRTENSTNGHFLILHLLNTKLTLSFRNRQKKLLTKGLTVKVCLSGHIQCAEWKLGIWGLTAFKAFTTLLAISMLSTFLDQKSCP